MNMEPNGWLHQPHKELFDFYQKLKFSRGIREATDIATLEKLLGESCLSVVKTDEKTDREGTDYIATLRKGAKLNIDAKARDVGALAHWKNGQPEFALEKWSIRPGGEYNTSREQAKTGWTLCETKNTDLIFFTYHPSECPDVFLVSFPLLRMAFRKYIGLWYKNYKVDVQKSIDRATNHKWESECVFVPVDIVYEAIKVVSHGKLVLRSR